MLSGGMQVLLANPISQHFFHVMLTCKAFTKQARVSRNGASIGEFA